MHGISRHSSSIGSAVSAAQCVDKHMPAIVRGGQWRALQHKNEWHSTHSKWRTWLMQRNFPFIADFDTDLWLRKLSRDSNSTPDSTCGEVTVVESTEQRLTNCITQTFVMRCDQRLNHKTIRLFQFHSHLIGYPAVCNCSHFLCALCACPCVFGMCRNMDKSLFIIYLVLSHLIVAQMNREEIIPPMIMIIQLLLLYSPFERSPMWADSIAASKKQREKNWTQREWNSNQIWLLQHKYCI